MLGKLSLVGGVQFDAFLMTVIIMSFHEFLLAFHGVVAHDLVAEEGRSTSLELADTAKGP